MLEKDLERLQAEEASLREKLTLALKVDGEQWFPRSSFPERQKGGHPEGSSSHSPHFPSQELETS